MSFSVGCTVSLGRTIHLFLSGDYEFLRRMYGLTGASGMCWLPLNITSIIYSNTGRHNCLWCHITSSNLKVPLEKRGCCTPRSLETLQADYKLFMSAGGGNIKLAKLYNNVIEPYFFDIPLENVPLIISR